MPLFVLAGKEYGSGSSRDWAAKGPQLLGRARVIAESYERIHRSNLVGMGVLPLQFPDGESVESLGLTGEETFDLAPLEEGARDAEGQRLDAASSSTRACGSTRRRSGCTTATAGSCTTSCASCAAGRLPAQQCGDARGLGEGGARRSLHRGHACAGLERAFDEPFRQARLGHAVGVVGPASSPASKRPSAPIDPS